MTSMTKKAAQAILERSAKRNEEAPFEGLKRAVLAYLSECDNPVPDYNYRRTLRNQLRTMTGAPDEPRR